ncbi:MAG: TolC family protein [Desulfotomaculales bacterium]
MSAGVTTVDKAAWAKEPATPELTLQQAVEMALANSKSVKRAEYDVDRSYEVRQKAADNVKWFPAGPISGENAAKAAAAFTGLVQADIGWQSAKKSYEAEKDATAMSVQKAYYEVLKAQEKVRSAELAAKNAEWQYRVLKAKFAAGMAAQTNLVAGEAGLAAAKGALEAAKKALDDTYQQFNLLVGLWPEDRPVLVDRPGFEPLKVDNLDAAVERAVEESPSVWLAKQNIDYYKLRLDLYPFNSSSATDPYKAWEIDVSKKELEAASAEEQFRRLVRSIYYAARQVEDSYAAQEQLVATAKENLRVTEVKYQVGMATRAEVADAQAKLADAERSLLEMACQHEILRLAFAKPWAYAGTGSSSGTGSSGSSAPGSAGGSSGR